MTGIKVAEVQHTANDGRVSVATITHEHDEAGAYYVVTGRRGNGAPGFVCTSESYAACESMARAWAWQRGAKGDG